MADSYDEDAWLSVEMNRPVELPDLLDQGETLSQFVRRAVVKNPDFAGSARSCRQWSIDITVPMVFHPARIQAELCSKVHAALPLIQSDPANDRAWQSLNSLWAGRMSLDLRMALQPRIVLDTADEAEKPLSYIVQKRIGLVCLAAKRRDTLVVQLCERLRQGIYAAEGFLAGDHSRAMQPISSGWWDDRAMLCRWEGDELIPAEHAPAGTPHYRGIRLLHAQERVQASVAGSAISAAPRAICSDGDLREYYRKRVQDYPPGDPPPTERQDIAAALAHFGKDKAPSRERLRKIRRSEAPQWHTGRGRPVISRS